MFSSVRFCRLGIWPETGRPVLDHRSVLVADSGVFKSPRFLVPKLLAGDGCKRCLGKVGSSAGWGQSVGLFLKEGGLWKIPLRDCLRLLSPNGNTLPTGSTKSGSPVEQAGVSRPF